MSDEAPPNLKEMNLRYAGACTGCGATIPQGTRAVYDRGSRSVHHIACPPLEHGHAGASAEREYVKRHDKAATKVEQQKADIRAQYKDNWLGRMVANSEINRTVDTRALKRAENWHTGAIGEEIVAGRLDALAGYGIQTLHDRLRVETKRANIDHIAITPWGVWVIDAKRYKNKRPSLQTEGGLLTPYREHLLVGGRREDKLLAGMHQQIFDVQLALQAAGYDVPVRGMLCFVEGDWPLIGGSFIVQEIRVCWPGAMEKYLTKLEMPVVAVEEVATLLARHFPQA